MTKVKLQYCITNGPEPEPNPLYIYFDKSIVLSIAQRKSANSEFKRVVWSRTIGSNAAWDKYITFRAGESDEV